MSNQFVWFREWVIGRRTLYQLSDESGKSISTLKRLFHRQLMRPIMFEYKTHSRCNLMIDGTYFKHDLCLILYQDNTIKYTQLYRFSDGEHCDEITEDLLNLKMMGVQPLSFTSDGHRAILKAIRLVFPDVPLQRCLVHIQREGLTCLTRRPQHEAGQQLRRLLLMLCKIDTHEIAQQWIMSFIEWYKKHEDFLNQRSFNTTTNRYWYTHKFLRRTSQMIKRALPEMFTYLFDKDIPKSNNGLESFFGHLKGHLNVHRGLSKAHQRAFILWYLHLKNQQRK